MKSEIHQLFNHIDNVPQVPEVVRTLISQASNPDSSFDAIAENVEKEQIISMKVLRLVNSAHFGLSRKIGSINQALVMLGMSELKKLVIASGIISAMPELPNMNVEDFWVGSFRTATYAKWLADEAKFEDSDILFTAGLISDLGNILIHLGDPVAAQVIDQQIKDGDSRLESEREQLDYTSHEVCAELCRFWQFSDDLIDTIAKSGEPLSFEPISLPSCAIFVAKYISDSNNKDEEELLAEFPVKEWQQLGFNERDIAEKVAVMLELDTGLDGLLD
ncbi:MAG: HDOD domain-containing protein [Gammaproteobacteria bacterium]|nr:MAG: HDOD domain-containing protein [Gammaproteobacteria bacterium]RKZ96281.1 MAG: HDOD domain-containing protein [Gammaproteobacteria bacterium]RKZ98206.1 MAG: HDOD domain-containing protein [Gammaproteobacteria bacterium]RKZ99409.1 MAG: HDOD domain-containing protein [Gammaproteobacteria bacterium]